VSGALEGRRAIVTGAAANIGAATAARFAQEGARVVLVDRNPAVAETAAAIAATGADATALLADVSAAAAVADMAAAAVERMGGVDILVNNAAIHRVGPVTEFSVSDWDDTFAVNVRSCFLTARALVPHLRSAGGGAIVNTSSQVGLHGAPGATAYSASKGAIIAFTKALALELAGDGIRVNAICPGWVDTAFNAPAIAMLGGAEAHAELVRTSVPLGRQARPSEIAAGTLFLVSEASSYMTGQVLPIDGGVT
jgi:NAD(P)-dependent dehydrogenase (short-subunit alcohol dehydrogenase family)